MTKYLTGGIEELAMKIIFNFSNRIIEIFKFAFDPCHVFRLLLD